MTTTSAEKVRGVEKVCSAVLLESWDDRGCLVLRLRDLEGAGEEVIRCNADGAGLWDLKEASDRCLDALEDEPELGTGD
jgi:hypothetical protein